MAFLSLVRLLLPCLCFLPARKYRYADTPKGTDDRPRLTPQSPPPPNIKLNEMEYTYKGVVYPLTGIGVRQEHIVEYALPGESKFFNQVIKPRIFETSYEDIEHTTVCRLQSS